MARLRQVCVYQCDAIYPIPCVSLTLHPDIHNVFLFMLLIVMCMRAQLPCRVPVFVMRDTRAVHQILFQRYERAAAFEGAADVSYLEFGGKLLNDELVVIDQVAYVEVAGMDMQVAA